MPQDEALLATSEVLRLQRPTPVQSEALKTFITQTRPLVKDEEVFIQKERDWVALHTPEEPYPLWVKEFLEHHSWSKLFQSSVSPNMYNEVHRLLMFAAPEGLLRPAQYRNARRRGPLHKGDPSAPVYANRGDFLRLPVAAGTHYPPVPVALGCREAGHHCYYGFAIHHRHFSNHSRKELGSRSGLDRVRVVISTSDVCHCTDTSRRYAAVLVVFVTSGVGQSSGKTEQAYAYHRQTETSYQL